MWNSYDMDQHRGTSYLPFIGFMVFLAGMVVVIVGAAKYFTAKRQFNLFYDKRDSVDMNPARQERDKKVGKILMIIGVIMMVLSFIIL